VQGLMMDRPLLLKTLLWRAERVFADQEVVSRLEGGGRHRYTYADYGARVRRLARALEALGVGRGDRVGTLAWNTHRHFEAYFAVPCMGAVLHTINLRLFPDQIAHIVNHADDRVLLIDPDLVPLVEDLREKIPGVAAFVVLADEVPACRLAPVHAYEELLAAASPSYDFPDFDEHTASGMCYTSATTGDPKGVVYSHRSTFLHTLVLGLHGNFGVREDMTLMPISPMFHVNSWGTPYAAAMQGTRLVFPGPRPDAAAYLELIESERVTHAVGAVTVGIQLRDHLQSSPGRHDLSSLEVLWLGGQAPPRGLMEWFETNHGVYVPQGWGSTECSPLLTFTFLKRKFAASPDEELRYDLRAKQGVPLPGVEIRVVDGAGRDLPWDGQSAGELVVRGPWVASAYHDDPERSRESFTGGWFRIGDVGTVDPDGYVRLVDRTKDLIKSGGEWISSVDLENALMAHPGIAEATVVAVHHEKWLERPLACVVPVDRELPPAEEELRAFLAERFPKWWLPDEFVYLEEIPKTGVGKFDKKQLRRQFDRRFGFRRLAE
jgi:fatty-acyl-CoA synthase